MNVLKNLCILLVSLVLCLFAAEGIARLLVDFDSSYYAAPKLIKKSTVRRHPYGDIPVNSLGFFDREFIADGKPAIAYFGDSVTYGVGAGYPYRFTDLLGKLRSEYNHLNLSGGVGWSLDGFNPATIGPLRDRFKIGTAVYVMNLNDIMPMYVNRMAAASKQAKAEPRQVDETPVSLKPLLRIRDRLDALRGNSVAYTWARYVIKTYFMQAGFDTTGYKAVELQPEENREVIEKSVEAINAWGERALAAGITPCVVILPYEMQISKEAASVYRELEFDFSDAFVALGTQEIIVSKLDPRIRRLVLGKTFPERPVGTYFVYDQGDRIDFNHPNRAGHQVIAREIADSNACF